jgi:ATP-binding cassette subfamily G (WHITE) protein 2 (SNQ2)
MASSPVDSETLRSRPHSIVNVSEAKGIFNSLARELFRKSSKTAQGIDVEKGKDEDDVFDLREYLTSSNDANQKAGIKHKHVRFGI